MKLKQWIATYFTNHSESQEDHGHDALKTHYFKTTKDKAMKVLKEYYERSNSYHTVSVSEEHGEISVQIKQGKKAFMVVSVIMVRPYHTAIDFSVTTESALPIDFGYSHKVIENQYKWLKQDLPFIETSMAHKI
ncbi:cytosolic protein [Pontibacillus salicampi]|uniref:Cytosolic protein n=1 Tax=Pontibacillus salicampi TaxID=1449801 RepID=A0ABV6LIY8_9BACI